VVRFTWIEGNLRKIEAHGLGPEEVEHAFEHRAGPHQEREDGAYETVGRTPSGRLILIVWRYDEGFDARVEVIGVVTA
jgi:hypothetical protein